MSKKALPPSVYHLKITLQDIKPPIWRDILVPADLTLEKLHDAIQAAMGWGNSHLHCFIAEKVFYSDNANDRDERKYTVSQLLTKEKASIIYEYDFGDSWVHKIELKKILPADVNVRQLRCIKGKRACPPDDCGGVFGYIDMLETLQNTDHPEREELLDWLGGDFDPDDFDIDAVNSELKNILA